MRFYVTEQISPNIAETPEGFLVCPGVPIARTGSQEYNKSESDVMPWLKDFEADSSGRIIIDRLPEEVFSSTTIASFEGKPVTIDHPEGFVTPETWTALSNGNLQNVRQGIQEQEDLLLADIVITTPEAIEYVKSGQLRQLSCGYDAEYEQTDTGRGKQINIIGNHVALVKNGRAGVRCMIMDSDFKESEHPRDEAGKFGTGSKASVKDIENKWEEEGIKNDLFEKGNVITLSRIEIPKEKRGQGLGSQFIKELTDYADKAGKTVALTPSTDFGASSKSRLVDFYKRAGFVLNKGKNKDFSISEEMIRTPSKKVNDSKYKEVKTMASFKDRLIARFTRKALKTVDAMSEEEAKKKLEEEEGKTQDLEGFMSGGVFHPIRNSKGYAKTKGGDKTRSNSGSSARKGHTSYNTGDATPMAEEDDELGAMIGDIKSDIDSLREIIETLVQTDETAHAEAEDCATKDAEGDDEEEKKKKEEEEKATGATKDAISRASILAPDFTPSGKVIDIKRGALKHALTKDSAMVKPFLSGKTVDALSEDALNAAFIGLSEVMAARNNMKIGSVNPGKSALTGDSIAEINKRNAEFWAKR